MKKNITIFIIFYILIISGAGAGAENPVFIIGNDVVQKDIKPFTATVPAFGNGAKLSEGGGFEPVIFRARFEAASNASNTVFISKDKLTRYDSWKEGAFDGATVEVLRIVNGKFVSIRTSAVKSSGHKASGWDVQFSGQAIPADTNKIDVNIPHWSNPNAPYYFTVRAIGKNNHISRPAKHITITPPISNTNLNSNLEFKKLLFSQQNIGTNAPTNFRVAFKSSEYLTLAWNEVEDAKGYLLYRSDVPPDRHQGYSLELDDTGPAIRKGDMIILRHKYYSLEKDRLLTNRVWNDKHALRPFKQKMIEESSDSSNGVVWYLAKHKKNTKVADAGETYLSTTLTSNSSLSIGQYNHSGTEQQWYEVLNPEKTYTLDVWLRGSETLNVIARIPGGHTNIHLTKNWKQHSFTFKVPKLYIDKQPRRIDLLISGDGKIDVDNLNIYREDSSYLSLLQEEERALRKSGMGYLRTHGFIKTFFNTYNLEQLTNANGATTSAHGNSLPQTLSAFKKLGIKPWLQIEPH